MNSLDIVTQEKLVLLLTNDDFNLRPSAAECLEKVAEIKKKVLKKHGLENKAGNESSVDENANKPRKMRKKIRKNSSAEKEKGRRRKITNFKLREIWTSATASDGLDEQRADWKRRQLNRVDSEEEDVC